MAGIRYSNQRGAYPSGGTVTNISNVSLIEITPASFPFDYNTDPAFDLNNYEVGNTLAVGIGPDYDFVFMVADDNGTKKLVKQYDVTQQNQMPN